MTGDRSVKAKTMVGNAIATGDHATAIVTNPNNMVLPSPESVDIRAELAQLRALLVKLGGPNHKDTTLRLDVAEAEAAKPKPDKAEVGSNLAKAVSYAKDANGFLEQMNKLAPTLVRVGGWLGEHGAQLLALVPSP